MKIVPWRAVRSLKQLAAVFAQIEKANLRLERQACQGIEK
jgi:hypothetical protein